MELLDAHKALLEGSAIAARVADQRGYWSATTKAQLKELGFGDAQRRVPALVIPVRDVHGEIATYLIRPDMPREPARRRVGSSARPDGETRTRTGSINNKSLPGEALWIPSSLRGT